MKINEQEYNKIIAKNLKRLVYESGKTQVEVAEDLNINKSTLSCWMSGRRVPKMQSLDMLCHYFNVRRADIMEEQPEESSQNTLSPKAIELGKIFDDMNQEGQEILWNHARLLYQSGEYNICHQHELSEKEA